MKAYIFPGQGSQFSGMGLDLYEKSLEAKQLFEQANDILNFKITDIMFRGSVEELKQTKVTQPAIFLHSVILAKVLGNQFQPQMVAGHSLGEFSALVANKTLPFKEALQLVAKRALAMQKACEQQQSTMAAVLGLEDDVVEKTCKDVDGTVVAANYNCPGQIVISGEMEAIDKACELLLEKGAKRALKLPVSGAFHSPLMQPAREELAKAIENTSFSTPICPIYQNVVAKAVTNPEKIKKNLIIQLTDSVRWAQSMQQMITDGASEFIEVGPGKVLQGLLRKINRKIPASSASIE